MKSQDSYTFGEAYFDEKIARRYGRQHLRWDRRLSHIRESWIIERLLDPDGKGGRILDAPCGSGRFAPVLARLGYSVVSLDRASTMTDQAAAAGASMVVTGSLTDLPFEDDAFAAMICIRFLHHLPHRAEKVACLREMSRVVKGPIVASAWIDHPIARMRRARRQHRSTRYMISMQEFHAAVEESGLTAVSHQSHVPFWSPLTYFRLETTNGDGP